MISKYNNNSNTNNCRLCMSDVNAIRNLLSPVLTQIISESNKAPGRGHVRVSLSEIISL